MIPLNWKLKLPLGHVGLLKILNEQGKENYCVDWVINIDYQMKVVLPLHNRGKEEYIWNTGDPLGQLSVSPCPLIKINGKLSTQSQQGYEWPNPFENEDFSHLIR